MRSFLLVTVLVFFIGVTSCAKKENINGTVLVNVTYKDTVVPNAVVYMKANITNDTMLNFAAYDATVTTNAIGQAVFQNLSAGRYYFLAVDTIKTFFSAGERFVNVETLNADPKKSGGNRYEALIRIQ